MLLSSFDYTRPATLDDAVVAVGSRAGARVLAGGQSLVNVLKTRAAEVDLLVDVSALPELKHIEIDGAVVEIGAATTYADIAESDAIRAAFPRMAEMAAHTVDVQVRNRGTIGGNCCYADPCSNFPPLLVAMDAELLLVSQEGERSVPAGSHFLGAFRTERRPDEILRAVRIPLPRADAGVGYHSVQVMTDAWALARAVAFVVANGTIRAARVVIAAVEPAPRRQHAVEELLVGQEPTPHAITAAADELDELPKAIADVHGSAGYRRKLARVVTRRAVQEAVARDPHGQDGHAKAAP